MKRRWSSEDALFRTLGLCGVVLIGSLIYLHLTHRKAPSNVTAPMVGPLTEIRGVAPPARERVAHSWFDQAACLARTGRTVAPAPSIHRWVDAAGVVHYSDKPPKSEGSRDHSVRLADEAPPVTVTIEPVEARMPPHAISRAMADAVAIGKVFKDVFRLDTQGGLALSVTLAGSDAAFRRAAPNARSNSGVYFGKDRRIVVRTQATPEETLAVLRHEITHALVHEWIGHLPTALNEGLADYFEHFEVSGMGGQVHPKNYAWQMKRAMGTGSAESALVKLLGLPNEDFHAYSRSENYGRSLAVVSTLMSTPDGRHALGSVLQRQRARPCAPIDAVALLRVSAPGGFASLAQRWRAHQAGDALLTHSY